VKFIVFTGDLDLCNSAAHIFGGKSVNLADKIGIHLWQVLGVTPGEFPKDGIQLQDTHIRKLFGMMSESGVAVQNYSGKTVYSMAEAVSYYSDIGTKEISQGWLAKNFVRHADDGVYVVLGANLWDIIALTARGVTASITVSEEKPDQDGLWLRAKEGKVALKDAERLQKQIKKMFYGEE
jgi:hypothetical protein